MSNNPIHISPCIPQRPWIKICGLTRVDNALDCAALGPDAIGLVFYDKSPRNVSDPIAAQISAALPNPVLTVGVFVDEPYDHIMQKVDTCGLKGVQLHGNEPPALLDRLLKQDLMVVKALFAANPPLLSKAPDYSNASFFLIEYGKGILPGGNAEAWNYELVSQFKTSAPVLLAGGLTPDNVCEAIRVAAPAGVDVSSGVEKEYGIKDIRKVESFISRINALALSQF